MKYKEKLLILDLDETLIFSSDTPLSRQEDFRTGPFFTYKRPYLKELLKFCFDNFEVGVWTSATEDYAQEIIKNILQQGQEFSFLWTRRRCTMAYDAELQEHFWAKKLKKLRRLGYRKESIIVVDDSPDQWQDSYGNLVRVNKYFGEPEDNELKLLIAYLTKLKDIENIRRIEKRNWRNSI